MTNTNAPEGPAANVVVPVVPVVVPTLPSPDERRAALEAAVAKQVSKGWAVSSRSDTQVTLSQKKRIGVFWNVVLSVVTGGLWLIVIAIRIANRKTITRAVTVDLEGKVRIS